MKFAPKRGNSSSPPKREEQRCPFRARLWGARDLGCSKKKAEETLGRGELGHGLGALRDGVLGELSGEDQAHGGLDLPGGDRRLLVVARELGGLGGDLDWWSGVVEERRERERERRESELLLFSSSEVFEKKTNDGESKKSHYCFERRRAPALSLSGSSLSLILSPSRRCR